MDNSRSNSSPGIRFDRAALPGGIWFKLYDLFIVLGIMLAHFAALFNRKLRQALQGKKGGIDNWEVPPLDDSQSILFHVASYGEFEGIRPLISLLLQEDRYKVAVSFSSPSAAKTIRNTKGLWASGYMPHDTLYQQLRFMSRLDPKAFLVSKHDFWPNSIRAASALRIPSILINASFHSGTRRNLPVIGSFHRAFMKDLSAVWTVSASDAERVKPLLSLKTDLCSIGDSRYDRVRQRANDSLKRFEDLKEALKPGKLFIAGSCWQPGEDICWKAYQRIIEDWGETRLMIVPHEPTKTAIQRNIQSAGRIGLKTLLLSEWQGGSIDESILIIDKMGVLADLYSVGWAAYVGGGFGTGVHSVIEPAAHGLPVTFGPNHKVSHEAGLLLKGGGGFVIRNAEDLTNLWLEWLENPESYSRASVAADGVVKSREGASQKMMELLAAYLE